MVACTSIKIAHMRRFPLPSPRCVGKWHPCSCPRDVSAASPISHLLLFDPVGYATHPPSYLLVILILLGIHEGAGGEQMGLWSWYEANKDISYHTRMPQINDEFLYDHSLSEAANVKKVFCP